MAVFPMPGNHDDRDEMRRSSTTTRRWRRAGSPPQAPVQYAVDVAGVRLVCCDTTVDGHPHGHMSRERLAWLDETLSAAPDKPTVVATHHPPFPIGIRFIDEMRFVDPAGFASVISKHPQVVRVISGHVHRARSGRWPGSSAPPAPAPTGSCSST